jgi:hypothetical protein
MSYNFLCFGVRSIHAKPNIGCPPTLNKLAVNYRNMIHWPIKKIQMACIYNMMYAGLDKLTQKALVAE